MGLLIIYDGYHTMSVLCIFCLSLRRRQKELEEKLIEEEVAKRVEALVAERVEQELEKRKDEIEAEVLRRVDKAKRIMEKQMLEEMEKQREAEVEAQRLKEVKYFLSCRRLCNLVLFGGMRSGHRVMRQHCTTWTVTVFSFQKHRPMKLAKICRSSGVCVDNQALHSPKGNK